jgi:hypothetical protein
MPVRADRGWQPLGEYDRGMTGARIISADGSARESKRLANVGPHELPIAERIVCSVAVSRFEPYLTLHFWGDAPGSAPGPDYVLQIAGPLRLIGQTQEWSIDPADVPDPAFLRLVDKKVARAFASDEGQLDVEFTDGDRLVVPPFEFEPWELNGADGSLVVSGAGGGLSVWDPE